MKKKDTYRSPGMGQDGLERVHLPVPMVRKAFKDQFQNKPISFYKNVWKNSRYMESMSVAIYAFQYRSLKKTEISALFAWLKQVRCWEHSDDLSKIFSQALEENPQWVLPQLKKWNKSKNPWERRQSVVSLIEYHGKREKVLPYKELISFIHPLLADEDYYVQKGVGWTLREIYCIYPKQTMKFFEKYLNSIQSTAYSASVEKLDKKTKASFREQRKKYRESLRKK
jgi:3-methyladenine DNA glycosylase AlkD